MAKVIKGIVEGSMKTFLSIIRQYADGELDVPTATIDDVVTLMRGRGILLNPTDVDIDSVIDVIPYDEYRIVRYTSVTNHSVVTIALDRWNVPIGAIFIGSEESPLEYMYAFQGDVVNDIEELWDDILKELNVTPLEKMVDPAGNLLLAFYNNDEGVWVNRVYIKPENIDKGVGVSVRFDTGVSSEVELCITDSVEFVLFTRIIDGISDGPVNVAINSTPGLELSATTFSGGKVTDVLDDDRREDVIRKEEELIRDGWVNILAGLETRVMNRDHTMNPIRDIDVPLFEEPDEINPIFDKITATSFTKKRLSTV